MEDYFPDVRNSIKLLWGNPYGFNFGKQVKNYQLSNRNRMQKGLKYKHEEKSHMQKQLQHKVET